MEGEMWIQIASKSPEGDSVAVQAKRLRYVQSYGERGYLFQWTANITKLGTNNYKVTFYSMMMYGYYGTDEGDRKMNGTMGVIIDGRRITLKDWDAQPGYYAIYNNGRWRDVPGLGDDCSVSGLTKAQVDNMQIFADGLGCTVYTIWQDMTITGSTPAQFKPKSSGSTVLIGGERYYPVIGNGAGVDRYNIQIGGERY